MSSSLSKTEINRSKSRNSSRGEDHSHPSVNSHYSKSAFQCRNNGIDKEEEDEKLNIKDSHLHELVEILQRNFMKLVAVAHSELRRIEKESKFHGQKVFVNLGESLTTKTLLSLLYTRKVVVDMEYIPHKTHSQSVDVDVGMDVYSGYGQHTPSTPTKGKIQNGQVVSTVCDTSPVNARKELQPSMEMCPYEPPIENILGESSVHEKLLQLTREQMLQYVAAHKQDFQEFQQTVHQWLVLHQKTALIKESSTSSKSVQDSMQQENKQSERKKYYKKSSHYNEIPSRWRASSRNDYETYHHNKVRGYTSRGSNERSSRGRSRSLSSERWKMIEDQAKRIRLVSSQDDNRKDNENEKSSILNGTSNTSSSSSLSMLNCKQSSIDVDLRSPHGRDRNSPKGVDGTENIPKSYSPTWPSSTPPASNTSISIDLSRQSPFHYSQHNDVQLYSPQSLEEETIQDEKLDMTALSEGSDIELDDNPDLSFHPHKRNMDLLDINDSCGLYKIFESDDDALDFEEHVDNSCESVVKSNEVLNKHEISPVINNAVSSRESIHEDGEISDSGSEIQCHNHGASIKHSLIVDVPRTMKKKKKKHRNKDKLSHGSKVKLSLFNELSLAQSDHNLSPDLHRVDILSHATVSSSSSQPIQTSSSRLLSHTPSYDARTRSNPVKSHLHHHSKNSHHSHSYRRQTSSPSSIKNCIRERRSSPPSSSQSASREASSKRRAR